MEPIDIRHPEVTQESLVAFAKDFPAMGKD